MTLSAVTRELENLASQEKLEGAVELIERADQEYAKSKSALKQIGIGNENGQ